MNITSSSFSTHGAILMLASMLVASGACAHPADGEPALTVRGLYTGSIVVLLPMLALIALYAYGVSRLWRQAGVGHGIRRAQVASFVAGIGVLALATVWPLDALGGWSLAAHVAQHMLLLAVAAPLLILANIGGVLTHALPAAWARVLATGMRRLQPLSTHLTLATILHIAVMWLWHLPRWTAAALDNDALHWGMHLSFLLSGLWFWSAVIRRRQDLVLGVGAALLALVGVMMQMGLIGALLCFAPRPLYPVYVERVAVLGLDPLFDQQLAGLIMWVPACLPYLIGGLVLLAARFSADARRMTQQRDRARQPVGRD